MYASTLTDVTTCHGVLVFQKVLLLFTALCKGGSHVATTPAANPNTVEPLNKGHFGANSFVPCREVVPISEVKYTLKY